MRAVIQRVSEASVTINGSKTRSIGPGLLILLGISPDDTESDIEWLTGKISQMRIFTDDQGKMNLSVTDIGGSILVISQFTLFASTKKGNRPSFSFSASPETAIPLYESFIDRIGRKSGRPVQTGEFGADMKVLLCNDGPVTIVMDSHKKE